MRRRIERIVSRQQRVNILSRLGCLKYTGGRGRRVEICRNLQGRELISAIDNFDRACLWETKKNIELAGQRLISLWKQHKHSSEPTLNSRQVADRLNIGDSQLHQLSKNPTFPESRNGNYVESEIDSWKSKLDYFRRKGYRVPECLYAWQW
jgi:hypothetical protein